MAATLSAEEKLKRYKHRIEASKRWRESEGYDELWRRLKDLYRGRHFTRSQIESEEDRIAVNVAFSTINVMSPSISINYPQITVNARKPEDEGTAAVAEAVVNYQWKHLKIKQEFRRAAKDFLILGHGWMKTGYRFKDADRPYGDDELEAMFLERRQEADAFGMANPHLAGSLPTDDEILAGLPTSETVTLDERPFAERVSPWDIYIDPEATSMADLKWIAQKVVRPIEDVQNDKRYSASARKKLKADGRSSWVEARDEDRFGDDIKRVTIWEFYDLTCGEMSVFSDDAEKAFLAKPVELPYSFGHPFTMLRNYDIPDEFYPMGDLEAIEPIQRELNKLRSMTMNHRKRYARKTLYRADRFDTTGRSALASDVDNTMVPVQGDEPLTDAVSPFPVQPLPPEFYQFSDQAEADIDKVSGVNEYARGSLPEIRRTATEASIIQDEANSRAQDKLAVVEDAIAEVASHLLALCQQFLSGDEVARVVGDNGQPVWVPYTREDLEGEFDFEVEAGSTQPKNDTLRHRQALDMLNALGSFAAPGGPLNVMELLKHVLKYGFDVKNPQKFIQEPMDPMMGAEPAPEGEMPPGDPAAVEGPPPGLVPGVDAVDPSQLAQLQGQVGFEPNTLGVF